MEDLRSRSCVDWRTQEGLYGKSQAVAPYDLRCYSICHVPSYPPQIPAQTGSKMGRSSGGAGRSLSFRSGWSLNDPEVQRKRRVAGYKMYAAEGKIKTSFKKTFKWLKNRYTLVISGL